jgi:hypothetical protein
MSRFVGYYKDRIGCDMAARCWPGGHGGRMTGFPAYATKCQPASSRGRGGRDLVQDARDLGQDALGLGQDARGLGQDARGPGQDARGPGQRIRDPGQCIRGPG